MELRDVKIAHEDDSVLHKKRFTTVCPKCLGKASRCRICGGRGWVYMKGIFDKTYKRPCIGHSIATKNLEDAAIKSMISNGYYVYFCRKCDYHVLTKELGEYKDGTYGTK